MSNYFSNRIEGIIIGVFASFVACSSVYTILSCQKCKHESSKDNADDDCQSLFYGTEVGANGSGFPRVNTVDSATISALTTTHLEYSKLPFEIYKTSVENLPIACVDVVCKRKSDGKLLVFYRRDKPAAGIWWWPGGRLFRGETFFDCAVRKIRDETGDKNANVSPKGIIHVWNTFFPDSNWDMNRQPGREGTQTVNVTVFCELEGDSDIQHVAAAQDLWAVEKQRWISPVEALQDGVFDKYVSLNVKKAIALRYL